MIFARAFSRVSKRHGVRIVGVSMAGLRMATVVKHDV